MRKERDDASGVKYRSALSEGDRMQELYDEVFKDTEHAVSTQELIDLDLYGPNPMTPISEVPGTKRRPPSPHPTKKRSVTLDLSKVKEFEKERVETPPAPSPPPSRKKAKGSSRRQPRSTISTPEGGDYSDNWDDDDDDMAASFSDRSGLTADRVKSPKKRLRSGGKGGGDGGSSDDSTSSSSLSHSSSFTAD